MGLLKKETLDVGSPGYSKLRLEVKENLHQYILMINKLKKFLHSGLFPNYLDISSTHLLPNSLPTLKCILPVYHLVLEIVLIKNPFSGQVSSFILADQRRPCALGITPKAVAFSNTKLVLLVCYTKLQNIGTSCSRGGVRRIQHFWVSQHPTEI